jgi:YHS domain-containing protein
MFRALIEFAFIILIVIVARAVLTSVLKGVAKASSTAFRSQMQSSNSSGNASAQTPGGGDLHKDPICGTYVAESTPFRQHVVGQVFYYCSEACREKHAMAVR